jgi:hypothetical protein
MPDKMPKPDKMLPTGRSEDYVRNVMLPSNADMDRKWKFYEDMHQPKVVKKSNPDNDYGTFN